MNDFRLGYVYIRTITCRPGTSTLLRVESLADRLRHEYGRDESAIMAGSQLLTITSFTGSWAVAAIGRARRGPEGDVDLVESVSYLHGKHAFKFGFEYLDIVFDGTLIQRGPRHGHFLDLGKFPPGHPEQLDDSPG